MKCINTNIPNVVILEPVIHGDHRGFFKQVIHPDSLASAGINHRFVQLNHSKSEAGTLRGLHFQNPPYAQSKLVRVLIGTIYDVAVDIRPNSPTYGQHVGVELSAENHRMLYVPVGFAHGFLALTDCEVEYACGDVYAPDAEGSIRWDDPDVGIKWPQTSPIVLSKKDENAPKLAEIHKTLHWPKEYY